MVCVIKEYLHLYWTEVNQSIRSDPSQKQSWVIRSRVINSDVELTPVPGTTFDACSKQLLLGEIKTGQPIHVHDLLYVCMCHSPKDKEQSYIEQ